MKKYLVIDNRMNDAIKNYFVERGYTLIQIPESKYVYSEISSHVDIFCVKIKDKVILEKDMYNTLINDEKYAELKKYKNILCGDEEVSNKYPGDIKYNVCVIGVNVIHNFKYTDSKIKETVYKEKLNYINISQGYSKCSICVVDDNSCIVTDRKIYEVLTNNGIDVLLLENKPDIKLLKNGSYSNMEGFIGGAICKVENRIIVFGDLKHTNNEDKIREYISKKGLEIVDFKGLDLIDYGSVVGFMEEDII